MKVPFLLTATFLLSLPSFAVINTLLGLRGDLAQVVRALMATQAGLTIILASLAPFTALWYLSGNAHEPAILFNGLMFAVASFSAQWMLRREYMPLDPEQSQASLDAAHLAGHLRVRRHPDGMGAPAVHRRPRYARAVLPGGKLEQRLRGRYPDDLAFVDRPLVVTIRACSRLCTSGFLAWLANQC